MSEVFLSSMQLTFNIDKPYVTKCQAWPYSWILFHYNSVTFHHYFYYYVCVRGTGMLSLLFTNSHFNENVHKVKLIGCDSRSDASCSLPKIIYKQMMLRLNVKFRGSISCICFSISQEVPTGLYTHRITTVSFLFYIRDNIYW